MLTAGGPSLTRRVVMGLLQWSFAAAFESAVLVTAVTLKLAAAFESSGAFDIVTRRVSEGPVGGASEFGAAA